MKRSTMLPILMWLLASIGASGCSLPAWLMPERPVRVGAGQVAELSKPVKVRCWVKDKATGKVSERTVEAWQGWLIGPGDPVAAPELGK